MKIIGTKEELIKFRELMKEGFTIKSRKELRGLLDWYDELLETEDRRRVITKIFQNYKISQENGD